MKYNLRSMPFSSSPTLSDQRYNWFYSILLTTRSVWAKEDLGTLLFKWSTPKSRRNRQLLTATRQRETTVLNASIQLDHRTPQIVSQQNSCNMSINIRITYTYVYMETKPAWMNVSKPELNIATCNVRIMCAPGKLQNIERKMMNLQVIILGIS